MRQRERQPASDVIKAQGRTVAATARWIGCTYGHLGSALLGIVAPSPIVRELLPKLLECPLEELFTEELLAEKYTGPRGLGRRQATR